MAQDFSASMLRDFIRILPADWVIFYCSCAAGVFPRVFPEFFPEFPAVLPPEFSSEFFHRSFPQDFPAFPNKETYCKIFGCGAAYFWQHCPAFWPDISACLVVVLSFKRQYLRGFVSAAHYFRFRGRRRLAVVVSLDLQGLP
jgi:hypothetical protein